MMFSILSASWRSRRATTAGASDGITQPMASGPRVLLSMAMTIAPWDWVAVRMASVSPWSMSWFSVVGSISQLSQVALAQDVEHLLNHGGVAAFDIINMSVADG